MDAEHQHGRDQPNSMMAGSGDDGGGEGGGDGAAGAAGAANDLLIDMPMLPDYEHDDNIGVDDDDDDDDNDEDDGDGNGMLDDDHSPMQLQMGSHDGIDRLAVHGSVASASSTSSSAATAASTAAVGTLDSRGTLQGPQLPTAPILLQSPPSPQLPPPPPPLPSQEQLPLQSPPSPPPPRVFDDNSVFGLPLLFHQHSTSNNNNNNNNNNNSDSAQTPSSASASAPSSTASSSSSSSASSSSSSSTTAASSLPLFHHQQHHQHHRHHRHHHQHHRQHSDHPHQDQSQQHSPSPSHQQHALSSSTPPQQHGHSDEERNSSSSRRHSDAPHDDEDVDVADADGYDNNATDDNNVHLAFVESPQREQALPAVNAIADTIDAAVIETPEVDNAASTSNRQQQNQLQPQPSSSGSVSVVDILAGTASSGSGATRGDTPTPPRSLPLLLQDEQLRLPQPFAAQRQQQQQPPQEEQHHFTADSLSHSFYERPPPRYRHQQQHPHLSGFGSSGNFYKNNGSGSSMFTDNENHHSTTAVGCGSATTTAGPHTSVSGPVGHHQHHHGQQHNQMVDRLKMLYPNVNENETPLPRCWSSYDKCLSIGLSQNNLRVHYRGTGKQNSDAASVRTAYPIPPACGLYYFEVKIISKGKNGYMGIGLTAQQFRMNRLPGWDKQSYGYHGDDGNSFSSSGNGQSYGPTFTTGDVIGCCVNFVTNTCFYTKNGLDLGIAFRDLPTKLFPTVGLQTPGEEVDANFGQEPFQFDQIEDMMKEMRAETKTAIYDFPMPLDQGDPTTLLHKMVSSYLVHSGYSQTAEAFGKYTGQTFKEDLTSIRNRQKILKLVMSGKMGQAIELTLRLYPGLLESNRNLWFMLKCRQFIEMINGSDVECCSTNNTKLTNSATTQTQTTPPNQTSVIQSTKSYQNGKSFSNAQTTTTPAGVAEATTTPPAAAAIKAPTTTNSTATPTQTTTNSAVIHADNHHNHNQQQQELTTALENNCGAGDSSSVTNNEILAANLDYLNDIEMENNGHFTNGNSCKNGDFNSSLDVDEEMDVDVSPSARKYSPGIERILEFGKELSQMGQQLEKENKMKDEDRQMLEDAFSLIAYSNPWSSPLGWQLCPTKRETVCKTLNSAILESMNYARCSPLAVCVAHASELLKLMAQASLGACAFVSIDDVFSQN